MTDADVLGHRQRCIGVAYRILGRMTDAEDAVQEAYARWAAADHDAIANPGGWLTTVCTRICLDRLKAASTQRETYVGPWLPEPILTDDLDFADAAAAGESLTMAFLVVLESLSPLERVAFLLHDVFDHPYDEIATMLDRSPTAVRQLVSRARQHVRERRPRFEPDGQRRWDVARAFLDAVQGGELDRVLDLLAPDVVFTADSGGAAAAPGRPINGARNVARIMLGLVRVAPAGLELREAELNGMPGVIGVIDGQVDTALVFDVADGVVTAVRAIRNPDKLAGVRS